MSTSIQRIRSLALTGLLLLAACGPGQGGGPPSSASGPDLSEALFAPDHLIEVEVEIDPLDWETLSFDGRSAPTVFAGCGENFEYEYFRATVTVDGETYRDVAIRKKGFLGSLSALRPSLKLNFGKFVEGRTHADMKRMTLNNNRQDTSNTHQCMAYELFRDAGAIAPRCNFAHVVVNGVDLGIYTHVESIKKPMLRRHFLDDDGNLYEGQGSDFTEFSVDRMELKTNEEENDRSDLTAVIRALEADDDDLIEALGQVVDLDSFLTFWAMEVITSHWDSYAGNSNNYLTYHDPTSDKFYFIPWGTDGAFQQIRLFNPENTDVAVLAAGEIATRLYETQQGRQLYVDRLGELFDQVWDEEALLAETNRIGVLTDANAEALEAHRAYILQQGTALRAALERDISAYPDWVKRPEGQGIAQCTESAITRISGQFSTTWDEGLAGGPGQSLDMVLNGEPFSPDNLIVGASVATQGLVGSQILMINSGSNGQILAIVVQLPDESFEPGVYDMHGLETSVLAAVVDPANPGAPQILGFAGDGTITLEAASQTTGAPVVGSFDAEFVQFGAF